MAGKQTLTFAVAGRKALSIELKKFWLDQSRKYDVFHDVFPGYYNRPQEIEDNAYANFSEDKQGLL